MGCWLTVVPNRLNDTILSAEEWRDNVRLRYNFKPMEMPDLCDGCGAKLTVEHALQCKVGGLVHMRHNDLCILLALSAAKLSPLEQLFTNPLSKPVNNAPRKLTLQQQLPIRVHKNTKQISRKMQQPQ